MATATVCDFCGNLIEGTRVVLSEQEITTGSDGIPVPDPSSARQQDFHPECRTAARQLVQDARPQPPDLPPTGPPT